MRHQSFMHSIIFVPWVPSIDTHCLGIKWYKPSQVLAVHDSVACYCPVGIMTSYNISAVSTLACDCSSLCFLPAVKIISAEFLSDPCARVCVCVCLSHYAPRKPAVVMASALRDSRWEGSHHGLQWFHLSALFFFLFIFLHPWVWVFSVMYFRVSVCVHTCMFACDRVNRQPLSL